MGIDWRQFGHIGAKIRLAHLKQVSYMLVLGAREERTGEVAV